jgi:hypothetical protein
LSFTITAANAGNEQAAMTWDSLHFAWSYNQFSGTGIFVPNFYNVTIVRDGQTSQFDATKNGTSPNFNGPTCVFGESGPGFSAFGVAGGTFIWTSYVGGSKPKPAPFF